MKKSLVFVLVFSIILSAPLRAIAECQKPVTKLEEGSLAPCRGFLFTPEKEQETRLLNEDYKLIQKELEIKDLKINKLSNSLLESDKIVELEQKKSELWRNRAEDSSKKLIESENGRGTRDFIFLGLGILLTVGAGFAIGQAGKASR